MTSSVGSWATSLLSAEVNNSLASVKFDFTLMKLEAPIEFSGLGAGLSTRRRIEAEDGPHHRTARRLAALFDQLVPSTPKLITAYGIRSSEIIQTPGINPKGSTRHGPFEAFVGADGTAMWAAATSGIPALGVYLLACVLARAWEAKKAISIWVELVEQRRKDIEEGCKHNHHVSDASRMSVLQDIRRDDLARWDASARAWLQSADQAKAKEHAQLMLIIKSAQLPFNDGESTYSKVIEAWRQAMSVLENLLCGRPQEISSRSILVALSAWHLYPDILVLGRQTTPVKFNDCSVDPLGIATIAKEPRSEIAPRFTSWSLTLSHYRYYGDPVTVRSETDFSRVNIQQLHLVALGSLFHAWRVDQRDLLPAAKCLVSLWNFLCQGSPPKHLVKAIPWLEYLAHAAEKLLISDTEGPRQLFTFGKRRAKDFLGISDRVPKPFFGLASEAILDGLSQDDEEERAVAYLRKFAAINLLPTSDAFIWSSRDFGADNERIQVCEYRTVAPYASAAGKRDSDGNILAEAVHARWLHAQSAYKILHEDFTVATSALQRRFDFISRRGEEAFRITNKPEPLPGSDEWEWENPPFILRLGPDRLPDPDLPVCPSASEPLHPCQCFKSDGGFLHKARKSCKFSVLSKIGSYHLLVNQKSEYYTRQHQDKLKRMNEWLHPSVIMKKLEKSSINASVLTAYLQFLVSPATEQGHLARTQSKFDDLDGEDFEDEAVEGDLEQSLSEIDSETRVEERWGFSANISGEINYTERLANDSSKVEEFSWALQGLVYATQVYQQLEGATISLKVTETSLGHASWLRRRMWTGKHSTRPHDQKVQARFPVPMLRANTLCCIAHFESGIGLGSPEDFEETLAIASGNSIFVLGALISDPFDYINDNVVRRIVGNIGRTGICMLVAPVDPRIRPMGNEYNLVNHTAYDGKREDNFKSTSLSLSFTDWTMPLEVKGGGARTIDQEAYFVESVISVLESGKWVADLDILQIKFKELYKIEMLAPCPGHPDGVADYDYTSIDNWEELLDSPVDVGIFRARGNWAARLAAVSILFQQGNGHSVGLLGPEEICLQCLHDQYEYSRDPFGEQESPLPSFCID